jgi:uncharacterized membrane protein YccC
MAARRTRASDHVVCGVVASMKLFERFSEDGLLGVHFAANVFMASIIVWIGVRYILGADPIWAIASMIASSEPLMHKGLKFFRSRLVNTMVGCAVGLLFVSVGEPSPWRLPFALAITVLLSAYFVRVQVMWRQAPITAALVIAGSVSAYSKTAGIEVGLYRVAEVIFGSVVGLGVSWLMAKFWSVREPGSGLHGAADQKNNPICRQDSRETRQEDRADAREGKH